MRYSRFIKSRWSTIWEPLVNDKWNQVFNVEYRYKNGAGVYVVHSEFYTYQDLTDSDNMEMMFANDFERATMKEIYELSNYALDFKSDVNRALDYGAILDCGDMDNMFEEQYAHGCPYFLSNLNIDRFLNAMTDVKGRRLDDAEVKRMTKLFNSYSVDHRLG